MHNPFIASSALLNGRSGLGEFRVVDGMIDFYFGDADDEDEIVVDLTNGKGNLHAFYFSVVLEKRFDDVGALSGLRLVDVADEQTRGDVEIHVANCAITWICLDHVRGP